MSPLDDFKALNAQDPVNDPTPRSKWTIFHSLWLVLTLIFLGLWIYEEYHIMARRNGPYFGPFIAVVAYALLVGFLIGCLYGFLRWLMLPVARYVLVGSYTAGWRIRWMHILERIATIEIVGVVLQGCFLYFLLRDYF